MQITRFLTRALCLMVALSGGLVLAQAPIKLVTTLPLNLRIGQQVEALTKAAFAKLDVPYTLEYNPAERASKMFENGHFDGDVARVELFAATYPEAIRILPGHQTDYYVMISLAQSKSVADVKSFDQLTDYRVAYRRGVKGIENRTSHVRERTSIDSWESCLAMVISRRVDVCLGILLGYGKAGPDKTGTPLGQLLLQDSYRQQLVVTQLGESKNYIWLAPQHKNLAARLSAVLKEMEKSGEMAAIFSP
jgi:hypothetical protein